MEHPTDPSPELRSLLAECITLYEESGPAAVECFLERHAGAAEHLRARLEALGRIGLVGDPPAEALPERIAGFRILGVLGRGGMGVVYEAQQEHPRRKVALKLLRSWPGEKARARFQHEAELLARLQHPNVASIFEAGTAVVGGVTVPWFAMELVRGAPIDDDARERALALRARLALLEKVAHAVQHAHQKGIVHRDLKPQNVLVDEHGEPRVLDFGLARVLDPDLEVESLLTNSGQLMGTLAYMSPEQATGDPREVDSRSDLYSLGVLGFELLAGRLPIEVEGLTVLEALRRVAEEEPPRLGALDRALRGDLETIFAKALAKEKERRYPSAAELAADIRRFLDDEPIAARPATLGYQLAKLARRRRGLFTGAAAALLALALGLAGTIAGLLEAGRERDDAERRFRLASAVLAFEKRMFAEADPRQEGVRVEDLLGRALLLVEGSARDAAEEAAIRAMLGEAYASLGRHAQAEELLSLAVAAFEEQLGPRDLQSLATRMRWAELLGRPLGRMDDGERAFAGVLERAVREHGAGHEVALDARLVRARLDHEAGRNEEAATHARAVARLAGRGREHWEAAQVVLAKALNELGRTEEALAAGRVMLEQSRARYGEADPRTWRALDALGVMLQNEGRLVEGGALVAELVALREAHLGPHHPDTLNDKVNQGYSLYLGGQLEEAQRLLEETVAVFDEHFPPDFPLRFFALHTLGIVHWQRGSFEEAERIQRAALEHAREQRGPEHQDTLHGMDNLASTLLRLGRVAEAEALLLEALETNRRVRGAHHRDTLSTMFNLGQLYSASRRPAEALPLLEEAVALGEEHLGSEDAAVGAFLLGLGWTLSQLSRFEEAEGALLASLEWKERTASGETAAMRRARSLLHELYTRWGKPGEASRYAPEFAAD